jgi:hypothetical protein
MRTTGSRIRVTALVVALAVAAATGACTPPGPPGGGGGGGSIEIDLPLDPATCDPLGGARCLLPFPNDYYTVADGGTDTGRRLALARTATPANVDGVHIDPTELNRNDGFSPGSAIVLQLPGVDLAASGAVPITDMGRYKEDDAPIVVIDAVSGRRHPIWVENDSKAPDDAHRLTFVRPSSNFKDGHRYVVAVRGLVDTGGQSLPPSDVFRAYRDRLSTGIDAVEARRPHMESLFETLRRAGIGRRDLTIAWDFTVASKDNLSERLLAMRDDAFTQLGEAAPHFTVTASTPSTRANLLREVEGTFEVPNYLTGTGASGSVLNNGSGPASSPIPARNGTLTARFICTIPSTAVDAGGHARPTSMALYGHGLLGSASEVRGAGSRYALAANTTFCATWWIGMSQEDIGSVLAALSDMSAFRTIPDRLQQSIVNFLFLGRLLKHPGGFSSDPAFQDAFGAPVLDQQNLSFVGVSQGGILGPALTAVAQDWARSFFGVGAINYSTLLDRSVDFDAFATVFDPRYPDWVDRQMAILLAQVLWDRGEGDAYANHIVRRPYRDTPAKQVMLYEAFGDHQVANVATEVLARTLGVELRAPALADGRSADVVPFWGIKTVSDLPDAGGNYLVVWDFGTPTPPTENVPNRAGDDPHGMGRDRIEVLSMVTTFLADGSLIDTCGGGPCQTLPPPG